MFEGTDDVVADVDDANDVDVVDEVDDAAHHESEGALETPEAPVTGDAAIDEAMSELGRAQSGGFAERIDAGERAHRLLQGRLDDLGGV